VGEILVAQGVISNDQLNDALGRQKTQKGARLGPILVDLGFATDVQICEALAEQLQIPAADLVAVDIPNAVLNRVTKELATKHLCLPWFVEGRDLYLIMADPTNVAAADAVAFHSGLRIRPVVAPEAEILAALEKFYAAEESSLAQFENIDIADQLSVVTEQETELGGDESCAVSRASVVVSSRRSAIRSRRRSFGTRLPTSSVGCALLANASCRRACSSPGFTSVGTASCRRHRHVSRAGTA